MLRPTSRRFIIYILLTVFLVAYVTSCIKNLSNVHWRPALLVHEVINGSAGFQTLWMKSSTFTLADDSESFLTVVNDQVIFVGSLDENRRPSLMSLELLTGNLQWDKPAYPTGFASDSNSIYIGESTSQLSAISLATGEVVWETQLSKARNFVYLIPDDSSLHVLSSTDNYYKVDKDSGELEDSVRSTTRIFVDGGIVYLGSIASAVMTVEDTEGNRLWQTPLNDPFSMKPIFTDELILIRTLQGAGPSGQLYVLDRETGVILWETNRGSTLSNAAIGNGVVYYVTVDAKLIAADVYTGQILGTIGFTPEIATTDLVHRRFSVAADNDNVVVYLGDSRQLFAFHHRDR